jgi:hypothetical protein
MDAIIQGQSTGCKITLNKLNCILFLSDTCKT